MPGCPRTCPKVKQQLKAERKKAREAGLRPPDEDKRKVREDRIPIKEPTAADFDSELDHDSHGRTSKSPGSHQRPLRDSEHNLLGNSSKDLKEDGRKSRGRDSGSQSIDFRVSDGESKGLGNRGEDGVAKSRLSSDLGNSRRDNAKAVPFTSSAHGARSSYNDEQISKGSRNQQRSSRNSDHNILGSSSKDLKADRRKNRDGGSGSQSSDFGGSNGKSRGPGNKGKDGVAKFSLSNHSGNSGRDNAKAVPFTSSVHGERSSYNDGQISKGSTDQQRSSRNSDHNILGSSSKDLKADRRKNRGGGSGSQSSNFGESDGESRGPGKKGKDGVAKFRLSNHSGNSGRDNAKAVPFTSSVHDERSSYIDGQISKGSTNQQRSLRDSEHNLLGNSSKDLKEDRRKSRGKDTGSQSSDFGGNDGESRDLGNRGKDGVAKSRLSNHSGNSGRYSAKPEPFTSSVHGDRSSYNDGQISKGSTTQQRSLRDRGYNLSGSSNNDRNSDKRKNLNEGSVSENNDFGEKYGESRGPANRGKDEDAKPGPSASLAHGERSSYNDERISKGSRSQQRSSRNSDHSILGSSSKDRKADRRKNLNRGSRSENSDFKGSDGESRGPGNRGTDGDAKSRLSNRSGKSERDNAKPGPSKSSAHGERSSFNDNPCPSECSLRRLKEEMMRRKREAKQKAVDEYLLNKGMNYFEDLCNCCSSCLAKQLWSDPFVRKMLVSISLFAIGIKLCWEMDAWYIPTR